MVLCTGLSACGRYGFDPQVTGDAQGPDDGAVDTDTSVAPDGMPLPMFGSVESVDELSMEGFNDEDPSLTDDELEIYFTSDRDGIQDIWRATRASVDDPFGDIERVDELSSDAIDGTPEVSANGRIIYFSSNRGIINPDIWRSERAARDDPWDEPEQVVETIVVGSETGAVRDEDELNAVFAQRDAFSEDTKLFRTSRATVDDPWDSFEVIEELTAPMYDGDPTLSPDGRILFFASDREGTSGGIDIWRTSRLGVDQPFNTPAVVLELGTGDDDEDPWLSPDLRTLYFVRNTGGEKRIYRATR